MASPPARVHFRNAANLRFFWFLSYMCVAEAFACADGLGDAGTFASGSGEALAGEGCYRDDV